MTEKEYTAKQQPPAAMGGNPTRNEQTMHPDAHDPQRINKQKADFDRRIDAEANQILQKKLKRRAGNKAARKARKQSRK